MSVVHSHDRFVDLCITFHLLHEVPDEHNEYDKADELDDDGECKDEGECFPRSPGPARWENSEEAECKNKFRKPWGKKHCYGECDIDNRWDVSRRGEEGCEL